MLKKIYHQYILDLRFFTAFIIWFSIIAIYLSFFGFPMQFLRAESAVFIQMAFLPDDQIPHALSRFLFPGYNGHFTPLAFVIEVLCARIFGANEWAWFFRQTVVLSIFATATMLALGEANKKRWISAIAFTSVATLNPLMLALHSWPFMWMQIACMACASMALRHAIIATEDNSKTHVWFALLFSYAAMHFFGVGFAFTVAMIITITLIVGAKRKARSAAPALFVVCFLACAHAVPVVISGGGADDRPVQAVDSVLRLFTLIARQPFAAAKGAFATTWMSVPNLDSLTGTTVVGAALTVVCAVLLGRAWLEAYRKSNVPRALVAITFSATGFFFTCILTAARLRSEVGGESLAPFLVGDRYLVFPVFFAVIGMGSLLVVRWQLACVTVISIGVYSALFFEWGAQIIWPNLLASHRVFWEHLALTPDIQEREIRVYTEFSIDRCSLAAGADWKC